MPGGGEAGGWAGETRVPKGFHPSGLYKVSVGVTQPSRRCRGVGVGNKVKKYIKS